MRVIVECRRFRAIFDTTMDDDVDEADIYVQLADGTEIAPVEELSFGFGPEEERHG